MTYLVRALRFIYSYYITVHHNTFDHITGEAILSMTSDYNTIYENSGTVNGIYGIIIDETSDNNEVYDNCFTGSNLREIVDDDGSNNNVYNNVCPRDPIIPGYPVFLSIFMIAAVSVFLLLAIKKSLSRS